MHTYAHAEEHMACKNK